MDTITENEDLGLGSRRFCHFVDLVVFSDPFLDLYPDKVTHLGFFYGLIIELYASHLFGEIGGMTFVPEVVSRLYGPAGHLNGGDAGLGEKLDNDPYLFFRHDRPS